MIDIKEASIVHEDVKSFYKELHANPELGFEEYRTSSFIAEKLKEFGIEVTANIGKTGVVGLIRGSESSKTLMLRADIDALPLQEENSHEYVSKNHGVMHACGHDAHTSMLLGAAKYLSENRHLVKGTVKFVFQPAEEGPAPGGAAEMIKGGVIDDVDACMAIHVSPLYKTGMLMIPQKEAMASTDFFKIEILGKGGHGSAPHDSIDPIPALIEIMTAINLLTVREIDPLDPCVVSIGTINTPSSSWNIIPEKVEITGTFRSFSADVREKIGTRIKELSENIAAAHRCKVVYDRGEGYKPTVNDEALAKFIMTSAKKYLGDENVYLNTKPFTAGEDVGAYFELVPGALMWLGCAHPEWEDADALHSPRFMIDLDALAVGVQVHVNNVLAYFG